jgi:hypothetical protein
MERVNTAPDIFDRELIALRRERAAATVGKVAPVLDAAAMGVNGACVFSNR